ncbi:MAG: aspartate/glutamate racemase family protein [Phycisphaerales bacterium]
MAKHIGIVAVSPEGSAICYREIHRRSSTLLGDSGHPLVTLHNERLEDYISALLRDDWHTIGDLLARSARVLAAAGAEFCITPDNVMQHGVDLARATSPIPWLTMTELVADRVAADGRRTVGVIGTKLVMYGSTYQTLLGIRGIKVIAPDAEDAEAIDAVIFRELIHGTILPGSRDLFEGAIRRLGERGAEGVVLACSESPLLLSAESSPLPAYDAVALLADSAVRYSIGRTAHAAR